MTTGTIFFMISSGRKTPMEQIPTPDLAVPYAAPKPNIKWSIPTAKHNGSSAAHGSKEWRISRTSVRKNNRSHFDFIWKKKNQKMTGN